MITKIEIDGKQRIAVILDEYDSIEEILNYSDSILSLIQGCFIEDNSNVSNEAIYSSIDLVKRLQPSINQYFAMERSYFKDTETHTSDTATLQQCKTWR